MKKAFVKIDWIPFEAGGRKHPPLGSSFIAVAKFPDQSEEAWRKHAWSVRLELLEGEQDAPQGSAYAFAQFLSSQAPQERLSPGTAFELCEGAHPVAQVQVLLSERLIERLVALAA